MPQWLNFTLKKNEEVILPNITVQQAITDSPRKAKRAKTIHHLSRTNLGDVIVSVEESI